LSLKKFLKKYFSRDDESIDAGVIFLAREDSADTKIGNRSAGLKIEKKLRFLFPVRDLLRPLD